MLMMMMTSERCRPSGLPSSFFSLYLRRGGPRGFHFPSEQTRRSASTSPPPTTPVRASLWASTKQVPRARIWTRISVHPIIFYGDSENRNPEADFGLPKIENSTFHVFRKSFRPDYFSKRFRVQELPERFVCENCPGGVELFLPGQF